MTDSLGLGTAHESMPRRIRDAVAVAAELVVAEPDRVPELLIVPGSSAGAVAEALCGAVGARGGRVRAAGRTDRLGWVHGGVTVLAVGVAPGDVSALDQLRTVSETDATVVVIGDHPPVRPGDTASVVPVRCGPTQRGDVPVLLAAAATVAARYGLGDVVDAEVIADGLATRRQDATRVSAIEDAARNIGSTWPVVHGAGWLGATAANYTKGLLNADMKTPSFDVELGEALRSDVAGWGLHGDITRQVFSALLLRHDFEPAGHDVLFAQYEDVLVEVVGEVSELRAGGVGWLGQLLDLMDMAQALTLKMAIRAGLDPGPVPAFEKISA
ncbi:MAG: hypothetical protein IH940_02010 [Acidobacteria bacterium]|nr:hypothetical protein [Acidobacteriota bacterium]